MSGFRWYTVSTQRMVLSIYRWFSKSTNFCSKERWLRPVAMMLGHVKIVNPCYFIATQGKIGALPWRPCGCTRNIHVQCICIWVDRRGGGGRNGGRGGGIMYVGVGLESILPHLISSFAFRKRNTANAKQINTCYSEAVSMCPSTFILLRPAKTTPQNK